MPRVLVLGGTGWLGGETVARLLRDGAEVTCLARGSSAVPEGARLVRADRSLPGAYRELTGDWDDVIDLVTEPALVASAVAALGERAAHWSYVSSVSVYSDFAIVGADERAAVLAPEGDGYGESKVASENIVRSALGDRALIVRPGLIAGVGDPSDRLGYWPARLSTGGRVAVPTLAGRSVQFIDMVDLADWLAGAGRAQRVGTIDALGAVTAFSDFLAAVVAVTGFKGELVEVDDARLVEQGVNYWAGPGSLPLWLPADHAGMLSRSGAAYRQGGGRLRPLRDSLADILADERGRGVDRDRRSGLSIQAEARLLEG